MYTLSELRNIFEQELMQSIKFRPNKHLGKAMHYALLSGGKRLRPLLVLSIALEISKDRSALRRAMPAALAVEYVHTYSLVHDDLPAMDNDDYRRGRPSLHCYYDQATAILVGDALLADAFGFVAKASQNAAEQCAELAHAAGHGGLVAGQAFDLALGEERAQMPLIHALKTAALFEGSFTLAALSVGAKDTDTWRFLGHHFGMAFQLKDDIDDRERYASEGKLRTLMHEHLDKIKDLREMGLLARELFQRTFAS